MCRGLLRVQVMLSFPNADRLYQGHEVAIKIAKPNASEDNLKGALKELSIMSLLRHRHVIRVYGYNLQEKDGVQTLSIIMEKAKCSLQDILGKLTKYGEKKLVSPERNVAYAIKKLYIYQICSALEFLGDQGIVHGDLKIDNILIGEDGNCKVADFGLSKVVDKGMDNA